MSNVRIKSSSILFTTSQEIFNSFVFLCGSILYEWKPDPSLSLDKLNTILFSASLIFTLPTYDTLEKSPIRYSDNWSLLIIALYSIEEFLTFYLLSSQVLFCNGTTSCITSIESCYATCCEIGVVLFFVPSNYNISIRIHSEIIPFSIERSIVIPID